jgi:hypothetical protein
MTNSEGRKPKGDRLSSLLKVLDCLGKLLQIVQTGFTLLKHLGV